MRIDLVKILDSDLGPQEVACPVMSVYRPVPSHAMEGQDKVRLEALTVVCVGRRCGMFNRCFNVQPLGPEAEDHAGNPLPGRSLPMEVERNNPSID